MISKEAIKAIVDSLREQQVPPRVIRSTKEAKMATESDPTGKQWKVGESYYLVSSLEGIIPVPDTA